jgi:hypothetical protein
MELGTKSSDFVLFTDAVTNESKHHLHKHPTVYTINSRKEHCGRSTFQIKIAKLRQALGNAGTAGSKHAMRRPIAQAPLWPPRLHSTPVSKLSMSSFHVIFLLSSSRPRRTFICQVIITLTLKEQPLGKRNPGCRVF